MRERGVIASAIRSCVCPRECTCCARRALACALEFGACARGRCVRAPEQLNSSPLGVRALLFHSMLWDFVKVTPDSQRQASSHSSKTALATTRPDRRPTRRWRGRASERARWRVAARRQVALASIEKPDATTQPNSRAGWLFQRAGRPTDGRESMVQLLRWACASVCLLHLLLRQQQQ